MQPLRLCVAWVLLCLCLFCFWSRPNRNRVLRVVEQKGLEECKTQVSELERAAAYVAAKTNEKQPQDSEPPTVSVKNVGGKFDMQTVRRETVESFAQRRALEVEEQMRLKGAEISVHVVSHTHWDREWYLPFEIFRRKLIFVIDDVLDVLQSDARMESFHLDGQISPLLDYLEVRPERKEEALEAVLGHKLIIGPWYTAPDFFLSSGESLVRNLLYARKLSQVLFSAAPSDKTRGRGESRHGAMAGIAYSADAFGHNSQLPQLFRQFSIFSAVLSRGLDSSLHNEVKWTAADSSSSVLAIHLKHWYCNGGGSPSAAKAATEWLKGKIRHMRMKDPQSKHLLLLNGCDHTALDPFILDAITVATPPLLKEDKALLLHSNLPTFVQLVTRQIEMEFRNHSATSSSSLPPPLPSSHLSTVDDVSFLRPKRKERERQPKDQLPPKNRAGTAEVAKDFWLRDRQGELRYSVDSLSHIYSTRTPQKRRMWECTRALEVWAEPFAGAAWALGANDRYEGELIWRAWALILQSQAHDSVGACSVEEVHKEVSHRMAICSQIALQVASEALISFLRLLPLPSLPPKETFAYAALHSVSVAVFNPLPFPRKNEPSVVTLTLPSAFPSFCPSSLRLLRHKARAAYPEEDSQDGGSEESGWEELKVLVLDDQAKWDYMLPDFGFRKPSTSRTLTVLFSPSVVPPVGAAVYELVIAKNGMQNNQENQQAQHNPVPVLPTTSPCSILNDKITKSRLFAQWRSEKESKKDGKLEEKEDIFWFGNSKVCVGVSFQDGSVALSQVPLAHTIQRPTVTGFNSISLAEEAGDVYNSRRVGKVRERPIDVKIGPVVDMLSPHETSDGKAGHGDQAIAVELSFAGGLRVQSTYYLARLEGAVQVHTLFKNTRNNTVVFASFPTFATASTRLREEALQVHASRVYADSQFDLVERPFELSDQALPLQSMVAVVADLAPVETKQTLPQRERGAGSGHGVVGVVSRGLHQYELRASSPSSLVTHVDLVLLRASGELGDWGQFDIPSAQESGQWIVAQYAFASLWEIKLGGGESEEAQAVPCRQCSLQRLFQYAQRFNSALQSAQLKDYPGQVLSKPLVSLDAAHGPLAAFHEQATRALRKFAAKQQQKQQSNGGDDDDGETGNGRWRVQLGARVGTEECAAAAKNSASTGPLYLPARPTPSSPDRVWVQKLLAKLKMRSVKHEKGGNSESLKDEERSMELFSAGGLHGLLSLQHHHCLGKENGSTEPAHCSSNPEGLVLDSIKKAENRSSVMVRMHSISNDPVTVFLSLRPSTPIPAGVAPTESRSLGGGLAISNVFLSDASEERGELVKDDQDGQPAALLHSYANETASYSVKRTPSGFVQGVTILNLPPRWILTLELQVAIQN